MTREKRQGGIWALALLLLIAESAAFGNGALLRSTGRHHRRHPQRNSLAELASSMPATVTPRGAGGARVLVAGERKKVNASQAFSKVNTNATLEGEVGSKLNLNASANASQRTSGPFNLNTKEPAVGKVYALYFSTTSGEKVSEVQVWPPGATLQACSEPPAAVYDPDGAGGPIPKPESCKLTLNSQTGYPSEQRKANLRLAELAVCDYFALNGIPNCGSGCSLKINAPLPYASMQEPYVGAAIALAAISQICAESKESWQRDQCEIRRKDAALSAGLRLVGSGVQLRPLPDYMVNTKMNDAHSLYFPKVILSADNEDAWHDSAFHEDSYDVTKWTHEPTECEFCTNIACVAQKLMGSR